MSYDPYNSGWYLLPLTSSANATPPITGLTSGQLSTVNSHTIQGLVETVYVRVGNDILYNGLNGLDQAINLTSQSLTSLTSLQYLKNALVVSSRGSFSAYFHYNSSYGSPSNYQYAYNKAASAFFGLPIVPDFIFKKGQLGTILNAVVGGKTVTFLSYANNLAAVRSQLSMEAVAIKNINSLTASANSLYGTIEGVLNDLPPIQTNATSTARISWTNAKLWALDRYDIQGGQNLAQNTMQIVSVNVVTYMNGARQVIATHYNGILAPIGSAWIYTVRNASGTVIKVSGNPVLITYHYMVGLNPVSNGKVVNPLGNGYLGSQANNAAKAGQFQQNITLAITSAQSLNNTQTEQVRAYMLNFEQFYQSASALLNAITQIIQNMAQNIRPA